MKLGIRTFYNRALLSIYPRAKIFFAAQDCAANFLAQQANSLRKSAQKKSAENISPRFFLKIAKFFCGA